MKVSETVTLVLTRGIWTAKRELTSIVTAASNINRKSKRGSGSHIGAETSAAAPQVTIEYLKKIAALAHPVVCITVSMIFPVTSLLAKVNGFVVAVKLVARLFIKGRSGAILLIDGQAN